MGNTLSYSSVQEHTVDLGQRGKIKGLQYDQKARRYAGVPYALPPTGDHRWRKPRPLPASFSYSTPAAPPFDATAFRPPCAQQNRDLATGRVKDEGDGIRGVEDCLHVNIWTPVPGPQQDSRRRAEDDAPAPWPIVVWLHGGWFQVGDACLDAYMDPTELISTGKLNAIFVAVTYRLNIFGFLSSSSSKGLDHDAPGNFGLWDQRLALEWVRDTMGLFGGDVDNITLAGRSAGAYGVEAQMLHDFRAAGGAPPLFHRAWMASNAIPAQPKTLDEAQAQFDEVCAYFHIPPAEQDTLARLRRVPERDLVSCLSHLRNHTFRPVTDDIFFHSDMGAYIQNGQMAGSFRDRQMKLLIGEVANEETLYAQFNGPTEATYESLRLQVANYYAPSTTDKVLKQYALPAEPNLNAWKEAFGRIIADGQVRASTRFLIDALWRNGVSVRDIWRYRVDYRLSFIDDRVAPADYGVSHAMDGPLWNFSVNQLPTPEEQIMMSAWIKILVAFVHNDGTFDLGTTEIDQVKVLTDQKEIIIDKDVRFQQLRDLGELLAKS